MRSWPWQKSGTHRGWYIASLVVVLVLVAARVAAPYIVKSVVNHKLEDMPGGYQGTVEDVSVRMLAGEIGLQGFKIVRKNGLIPVPFMTMKELVLGFVRDSWRLRNTLRFVQPNASFVQGPNEERSQKGPPGALDRLQGQLPFQLVHLEVEDGTFHFRDFQPKPDIDAYASNLNVIWDKLVGCLPPGFSACRSNVHGTGTLMKSGKLKVKGTFVRDPESDFKAVAHIDGLRVPELNPVLKQYAKIDVQKGTADIDARYEQRGKSRDVLLTPYLRGFEVMGGDDKERTSFVREFGVAAAAGFFERRQGEKAIRIKSHPGHTEFKLVDLKGGEKEGDDRVKAEAKQDVDKRKSDERDAKDERESDDKKSDDKKK